MALLPSLASAVATTVASVVCVGVVVATSTDDPSAAVPTPVSGPPPATDAPDPLAVEVDRLSRRHDCSPYGLPDGVDPVHAIVRRGDEVRLTSFAVGWETYVGDRPGTLVAVCAR
jgi:hypothetical protein